MMEQHGVVNRIVPDDKLLDEAMAFVLKLATGPTRAHAAHKALLRIWATGGVTGNSRAKTCCCRAKRSELVLRDAEQSQ